MPLCALLSISACAAARIGEIADPMDRRPKPRIGELRPPVQFECTRNRGLLGDGPGPRRRARQRGALAQDRHDVDLGPHSTHEGDQRDAAVKRQRREVALEVAAADHVEDHIDATALGEVHRLGDEVLLAVVDHAMRTGLRAEAELVAAADGGHHAGPEGAGHLDRRGADTAGTAVDQEALAGLQRRTREDVVPDREAGLGHSGRFWHCHARRNRQAMRGGHHALLRIAAAGVSAQTIADPPALHAGPERRHAARDFEPDDRRGAGRRRIAADALRAVGPVHAREGDVDQQRAGCRHRRVRRSRGTAPRADRPRHGRRNASFSWRARSTGEPLGTPGDIRRSRDQRRLQVWAPRACGQSATPSRSTGARNRPKSSPITRAAISAPKPPLRLAS